MVEVMHLYVDDSGTRHPDRKPGRAAAHKYDWFSLGGVLIKNTDEAIARSLHAEFMGRWDLDPDEVYLHSSDIRAKTGAFTWLAALSDEDLKRFLADLYSLMATPPFLGFGCVIDRPGYNNRYREKYGNDRWMLCKTAFSVLVERAAKYAIDKGYKLKIFVERGDPETDKWMRSYYDLLRTEGMPFSTNGMGKYNPLSSGDMMNTLYEFRTKNKSSPIMQIADLYLWPISIGGYHRSNTTYQKLMQDRKLIDAHLSDEDRPYLGIKYSCWESVTVKP